MPIRPFLSAQAFEPWTIQAMSRVLEQACEVMGLQPKSNDPTTELVPKKIIELAQRGIREPDRLVLLTLQEYLRGGPTIEQR
jgi:hypothetical protein